MRVLHKGYDGFDIAFAGALRAEDLQVLEAARERAERDFEPALVQIGPGAIAMHVGPQGIKGGYRFACDTGFLGEKWFFSQNKDPRRFNIRVSAKSLPLAIYGIEFAYNKMRETLRGLGIAPTDESVSRVDYAIDHLMDTAFTLEPNQFVVHSRSGVSEYDSSFVEERVSPDDILIHFSGRRASSVTIGKQPGRQIIVYDKRREIVARHKLYWLDLWGLNDQEQVSVVRTELRAGKRHLREWQIRTFADVIAQIGDVFGRAVSAVRYVTSDAPAGNVSRRRLHPLWLAVQCEIATGLAESVSGVVPGRFIAGERERIRQQYLNQIAVLIPCALVASGYVGEQLETMLPALLAEISQCATADLVRFSERCARARDRMHFSLTEPLGDRH